MLSQGYILKVYEIHSVIGRGGFGVVYKGKHQELEIDVAIKEYFPAELSIRQNGDVSPSRPEFQASFEDGLLRFLKEAQQLERFRNCLNIVTCRDLFRANGTAYMVMEYISGLPLSVLLEQRESRGSPFAEQEFLELIRPLLTGLTTVHESGVCHRDIKPANILVRRVDGVPILIDFGAAKHELSRHTKSIAPYTDGYAAMEQIGEGKIGPWTDIYGLGAVMWRIVAGGAPPFSPPNPLTSQKRAFELMQGCTDPMPSARDLGRNRFSDKLLHAIDDCLIITVSERVQNCCELSDRLDKPEKIAVQITDLPSTLEVAEQGHAEGQYGLGDMYHFGEGVQEDEQEAIKWYRLAAEQGYAEAQFRLGDMYNCGWGEPGDKQEAVKWYRLAAEQGHAEAQSALNFLNDSLGSRHWFWILLYALIMTLFFIFFFL